MNQVAPGPEAAWGRELLGRLALMAGTGYPLADSVQRLRMDMGIDLPEEIAHSLLVAVGIAPPNEWSATILALLSAEVPQRTIQALLIRLRDHPAIAGFDLAELGLRPEGDLLAGAPLASALPARAAMRLAHGIQEGTLSWREGQKLIEKTGLKAAEALRRARAPEAWLTSQRLGVKVPRGFRFKAAPPVGGG